MLSALFLTAYCSLALAADAVVQLNQTQVAITRNNTQTIEQHLVIKVCHDTLLNENTGDQYRTIGLPFDAAAQKCEVLLAQVIQPDGKIVSVEKSQITDQARVTEKTYANALIRFIRLPALPGSSTIEYRVRLSPRKPSRQAGCSGQILLGDYRPVAQQELVFTVPKGHEFHYGMTEERPGPRVESLGNTIRYTWNSRQDSALAREPAEPTLEARVPQLFYSSFPTWRELADILQKGFARATVPSSGGHAPSPEIKQKAVELAKGKSKPDALCAIYLYVAQHIRTVDLDFRAAGYEPGSAGQVLKQGYGNCRDKVCLLAALLAAAGITAYPLPVRRNRVPVVKEAPAPEAFDWVICMALLNNNPVYLDPCSEDQPYGRLPESEQGCEAFVLDPKNYRFIVLPEEEFDQDIALLTGDIALAGNGSLSGVFSGKLSGYYDAQFREHVWQQGSSVAQDLCARLVADNPQSTVHIDSVAVSDLADPMKPVQFSFHFVRQSSIVNRQSVLVPQPSFALDTIFALTRPAVRRTSLVSYPWRALHYVCLIHRPEGQQLPGLPPTWFRENRCVRALISWRAKPDGIEFMSEFMLKKPKLSPEEYQLVRSVAGEFLKPELRELKLLR